MEKYLVNSFLSYYVKVTENQNLTCTVNGSYIRIYGYNDSLNLSNKIITGVDNYSSVTITIPSGVAYIRLQSYLGDLNATIVVN